MIEEWSSADGGVDEGSITDKLIRQGFRVTRYLYPPGTCFPPHTHGYDKVNVILSGRFLIGMDGREEILMAGQGIFIPQGAVHDAEVHGEETVICLDACRL